jgi:hypothetical protein
MAQPPLSDSVKELIRQARIVGFAGWEGSFDAETIAIFQAADDRREYLTDGELASIVAAVPHLVDNAAVVRLLRDRVVEIVDEARAEVMAAFPGITDEGGGLYPAFRAEACWRDFWHFLRCITYGIAGDSQLYTSSAGLAAMNLLYQELQVPLDAMVVGLVGVKSASLHRLDSVQSDRFSPYFDVLIDSLQEWTIG